MYNRRLMQIKSITLDQTEWNGPAGWDRNKMFQFQYSTQMCLLLGNDPRINIFLCTNLDCYELHVAGCSRDHTFFLELSVVRAKRYYQFYEHIIE